MTSDPALVSLTELAAAIRERRVSSVEATNACLARIAAWQPHINAFVSIESDEAMAHAKAADDALASGQAKGPLHGVPMAHKDMYYTKGRVAECGSKVRKGWVAPATATAVERLEAAGAFRLGALHMVEFAYGPTGHNPYLGHAHNPWNLERVTGGSSSGSGAAVAARLVPAALGSDTGGSIRLPAHFCGVTGLKPTYGRVSRANAMPLSFSLDTVGPLVQTATDAAMIMKAITGPDPLDPTTAGTPVWNKAVASHKPEALTIGVPASFYVEGLEADVAATLDATIATLAKLGHKIVKVELPDQTLLAAAGQIILTVEAAACHAATLRERPQDYGAQVKARLENGLAYSAVEYLEALRWRGPALAAHLEAIKGIDVIVAPACQTVAPSITETDVGAGPDANAIIMGVTRFMRLVNYLGLPSLVVPAGQSTDGLPIGMQLIGRPFGDELVTALGQAFQSVTDHHRRAPSLP